MSVVIADISDNRIIDMLKNGRIGVLPSDTQYGLMAVAGNQEAVSRLYATKQREQKPGTIIAASVDQLVSLGIKARYIKAVEQYWPNPLSIVIPCGSELQYLHRGAYGLAVRIPNDKKLVLLLEQTGSLLTSSANMPDEPPARTLAEAEEYFNDTVDFYVDGGDLSDRKPSTVIRIVDDAIEVLREGAVNIDEEGRIL